MAAQFSSEAPELVDADRTAGSEFDETWRSELLDRTWAALQDCERDEGLPYFSALRLRADQPEASAAELADALTTRLQKQTAYSEAAARKLLQRAREKFGDLLLREVAVSIETDELSAIERELEELRLLSFCKSAVDRRRG